MTSEYDMTKEFVAWLRTEHPATLFCATVGGIHSSVQQKAKMRAAGYNKGVPDLLIYEPSHDARYVGLALELKTPKGRISKEQQQWLYDLQARGWQVAIPRTLDECKNFTMQHLYGKQPPPITPTLNSN